MQQSTGKRRLELTNDGYDDYGSSEPCKKHGQHDPCQECIKEAWSKKKQAKHEDSVRRQRLKTTHPKKLERK